MDHRVLPWTSLHGRNLFALLVQKRFRLLDRCRVFLPLLDKSLEELRQLETRELESLLALTAIFHGGLLDPNRILDLPKAMNERLFVDSRWAWLDFCLDHETLHEHSPVTRWIADPRSVGVLYHLLGRGLPKPEAWTGSTIVKAANRIVNGSFGNFADLLEVARAGYEHYPPYLEHVAAGDLQTQSLSPAAWHRVTNDVRTKIKLPRAVTDSPAPTFQVAQVQQSVDQQLDVFRFAVGIVSESHRKPGETLLKHRRRIREELQTLWEQELENGPSIVLALLGWTMSLVDRDSRRRDKKLDVSSTVHGYITLIGKALIRDIGDEPLVALDPEDFALIYQTVLESKNSSKSRAKKFGRLQEFHSFIRLNYCAPAVDWRVVAVDLNTDAVEFADANIISEAEYQRTLRMLTQFKWPCPDIGLAIRTVLIFGYRFGLRYKEIRLLRCSDCHLVGKPELTVAQSRYFTKKTGNSRRMVSPWRLDEIELQTLKTLKEHVVTNSDGDESMNVLLFTNGRHPYETFGENTLRAPVISALRAATCDPTVRFRHLRHAAANGWLAKILQSHNPFYPGEPVDPFDEAFETDETVLRGLWKPAFALGHLSPGITLLNYLHICDVLIHVYAHEAAKGLSVRTMTGLFGLGASTARSRRSRCGQSDTSHHFYKLTLRRLSKLHTNPISFETCVRGAPNFSGIKSEPCLSNERSSGPSTRKLAQILRRLEGKDSTGKIARDFGQPIHRLVQWRKARRSLDALSSSRGGKRHTFGAISGRYLPEHSSTGRLVDTGFQACMDSGTDRNANLVDLAEVEDRLCAKWLDSQLLQDGLSLFARRARGREPGIWFDDLR